MPVQQRMVIKTIESLTGRVRLIRRYHSFQNASFYNQSPDVWDVALDHIGCRGPSTEQLILPKRESTRALLLIANHPFEVTESVTLAWNASRIDPNFRILSN